VLAAAVLAACSAVLPGRQWTLQAMRPDTTVYPVVVRDTTGRIVDVKVDPPGLNLVPFTNPGGQPNAVVVPWTGGACDARTEIDIAATATGLSLSVATRTEGRACILIGIEHRLVVTASEPIDPMTVIVGTSEP